MVLNGAVITPPALISTTSFLGVFQHEFAHSGPLDHEQINGTIALFRPEASIPAGFTNRVQTHDLFAPFVETTYPFLFEASPGRCCAPAGSRFRVTSSRRLHGHQKRAVEFYPTSGY